jgi:hypothetical protein
MMEIDPDDSVNIANQLITVAGLTVGLALLGTAWLLISAILLIWRFNKVPESAARLSGNGEDGAPCLQGFGANRTPVFSAGSSGAT